MVDYRKLYMGLFNSISDALETLEQAQELLKRAQLDAEEAYITQGEDEDELPE